MTAQAITIIEVDHGDGIAPADVARRLALPTAKPLTEAVALGNFFSSITRQNTRIRVRVDSVTGVAASRTVTITGANIAAAEWIGIWTPAGTWTVTAVSSGAASGDGTFNTSGTSSTAATNIANAINSLAGLKDQVVATTNSADLIVTAAKKGSIGNVYRVVDGTGNGISSAGLLSGGLDPSQRATATITCVFANTDNDDTVTIGGVVFTAKTSGASGEGQFNLGSDNATMTANLLAKIQAHSRLLGLLTASSNSNAITLTFSVDPRAAMGLCSLQTSDADGLVITQPALSNTLASSQVTRAYALGAP